MVREIRKSRAQLLAEQAVAKTANGERIAKGETAPEGEKSFDAIFEELGGAGGSPLSVNLDRVSELPIVEAAPIVGSVVPEHETSVQPAKRYRVVDAPRGEDGRIRQISLSTGIGTIKVGKVIDERYHDVRKLQEQGVKLELI